jgi:tetratricopeptide (TPR) repeat protein
MLPFALLLILFPLLPVLYIPSLSENVFAERYLYLPSVGFVILLSYVFVEIDKYRKAWPLSAAIIITILVLYSAGTVKRNPAWFDEYTFWTDTVKKAPQSSQAHNNLGNVYYKNGLGEQAIIEYQEALRIKPDNQEALYNLGTVYHHKGMLDEAIGFYKKAIQLNSYYFSARSNLGIAFAEKGEYDKAIKELKEAIELRPDVEGYYNLGVFYQRIERNDMAKKEFENALKINPDFIPASDALKEFNMD